jgi:hypothetical protein
MVIMYYACVLEIVLSTLYNSSVLFESGYHDFSQAILNSRA